MAAEILHWALALVPVIVMVALFTWLDVFKLMTWRELSVLLLLGGLAAVIAYPVSGRMLDALPMGFSTYSRFVAPWIEEALKGLVIVGLLRFNRVGYKLDAVISGFAVGAGFSVVENILYLWRFPELGSSVWLVRGLGTAVMHGTTLAVLAAIAHEFAERETRGEARDFDFNLLWFLPGYVAAVAIHTLFNQFPDQPLLAMIATLAIAPFLMMAIFHMGANEAQEWLAQERTGHQAMLDTLRAGRFPDDASGWRIAALANRVDPATAERIRRYWEVQAWLVVQAESVLLEQSSQGRHLRVGEAAAAFAQLEELRRSLGPSLHSTLKSLLPFSRNDYWEISELRERITF